MPRLGRIAGFLFATFATGWGCGGATISFPSDGGTCPSLQDCGASGSSSGGVVINPGSSSGSTGSSSGAVGSSTSSGSSSGVVSSSTSSGSGSGSGSSSGFSSSSSGSGGSSGSGSGGPPSCGNCTSDSDCQTSCPPVSGGGTNCCDLGSGVCYATPQSTCPMPFDAGCPVGGPICSPNAQGNTPPNPNTGSQGCDNCIECSCGMQWCACAGDSGVDGSGKPTGCLGYVDCFVACLGGAPDAGVPPGNPQQCSQQCGAAYSQQQQQQGNTLIQCLAGSCSTSTTCGG